MAGLVPAIHVLLCRPNDEDVDARDHPGHDDPNLMLVRHAPANCPYHDLSLRAPGFRRDPDPPDDADEP
ncbi:hypothetical protein CWO90_29070 [Bradyrhizobium sp. Leo121]|nr:hypothetical protein CWO90_29070 [Bradyrhizobium sp. Leo121]